MPVVIDTNVLIAANGENSSVSSNCVLACFQQLQHIQQNEHVVLDDTNFILQEYRRNLSLVGRPGFGRAFFKWLFDNRFNGAAALVTITPLDHTGQQFAEFPADPELANFDLSDRKFVAVALTHPQNPPILNAVDSDWANFSAPLGRYVQLHFLCP
jgi:hypothetical protein